MLRKAISWNIKYTISGKLLTNTLITSVNFYESSMFLDFCLNNWKTKIVQNLFQTFKIPLFVRKRVVVCLITV